MAGRSDLRAEAMAWDGLACGWPGCDSPNEEMAHIHGIGMGGRPSADTIDNVVMLCAFHHDMLDGRRPIKRWDVAELLAAYTRRRRERWE